MLWFIQNQKGAKVSLVATTDFIVSKHTTDGIQLLVRAIKYGSFGKAIYSCIQKIKETIVEDDLGLYEYATIFDPKVIDVLKTDAFLTSANVFNERYQELFDRAGTIYKKGVFNPARAETSFSTLDKQGFFKIGHRVHLQGETESIDKVTLDEKIRLIHASIDGDDNSTARSI